MKKVSLFTDPIEVPDWVADEMVRERQDQMEGHGRHTKEWMWGLRATSGEHGEWAVQVTTRLRVYEEEE